jgi:hypothetical protein
LVSVQVMPLASAQVASELFSSIPSDSGANFGLWCPLSGMGSGDCSDGYTTAAWDDAYADKYRYLVEATAVYTDLSSGDGAQTELYSAAHAAMKASGPGVYWGNLP